MKKLWFVFGLLVLLSFTIQASALNVNGTISNGDLNTTNYHQAVTGTVDTYPEIIKIVDIEKTQGLRTLVRWSETLPDTYDAGAPKGYQTQIVLRLSTLTFTGNHANNITGPILATGQIGYQRIFDSLGNELSGGYTYVMINTDWSVGTLTGTHYVYIDLLNQTFYNATFKRSSGDTLPTGTASWFNSASQSAAGWHTLNKDAGLYAVYSCDKPSGIGITGTVNKTNGIGGTLFYNSKVYIVDENYKTITNEPFLSPTIFYFNTNASQIRISLLGSGGQWANSSLLFAAPTPTPTPIGSSNSTTTTLHIWDEGGNHINGANIHIKDIENNTWTNSTHDPDGRLSIETQRDHHLDLYADYDIFANEFLPAQLLNQETGPVNSNYTYYLTLFDYNSLAPPGYTSLYVEVKDQQTHNYLDYSVVKATLPNGTYYTQSTSNLGHALFIVPNNTMINCAATQTGYLPGSILVNSTGASTFTTLIELSRQATATPTPYVPPTLPPTSVITQVPGTTNGTYTGFWGPFYRGLHGMGADDGELGVIMTAVFAVFGLIGGAISTGGNPRGASAGASLGFILSCAFKFINVWLVIVGVAWLLASFFLYRDG